MTNGTARSTNKTQQDTFATLADLQGMRREIHDEMSSLRGDIASFQREIQAFLNKKTETNWTTVLTAVSVALILAGMGGALINSVITAESSLREQSTESLKSSDSRTRQVMDMVLDRELDDSYFRGLSEQKFETLEAQIGAAIDNRKDIDAKHVSAQERLSERIDEVAHALDNGLGRRIGEMIAPTTERVIALEREVFGDTPNYRDADRK